MTARRNRPQVESLERRDNPVVIHPASTFAQLVTAVDAANHNADDDEIQLAANVTYDAGYADGLLLNESGTTVTITRAPAGPTRPTLDAAQNGRLFNVAAGTVAFQALELTNGLARGDGTTEARGGAVFVDSGASVALTGVLLRNNAAQGSLPATPSSSPQMPGRGYGGAVYNLGTLTVTSSVFDGNTAQGFSYSSQFFPPFVGDGQAGSPGFVGGIAEGGAIYGKGRIVGSVFQNNAARGGTGGFGGNGGRGTAGAPGGDGGAGGDGGSAAGGALAGQFQVYSSLLGPGNAAVGGNGGTGGTGGPGFDGATVGPPGAGGTGGNAGDALGGAVAAENFAPTAVLGNSTVSGNSATGGANGAGGFGPGGVTGSPGRRMPVTVGGVAVLGEATLNFASTTVANNTAGGVFLNRANRVNVYNSVFADNTGGNFTGNVDNFSGVGTVYESAALIVGFTSAPYDVTTGGNVVADPGLGALAANGVTLFGSYQLQTHPIGSGSPAANFGDATYLTAALIGPDPAGPVTTLDGRGNAPRTVGAKTDAGAFEAAAAAATQGDVRVSIDRAAGTFTVTNDGPDDLPAAVVTASLAGGTITFAPTLPGGTATVALAKNQAMTFTFTATVAVGGADATLTVSAGAGAGASDPNGGNNVATATIPAPLTVTVVQSPAQADPTPALPLSFDVDFSAPVAAFPEDLLLVTAVDASNNPLPRPTVTISPTTGTATHFTVTVGGLGQAATVTVSLAAEQVARAAFPDVRNAESTTASASFAPALPHFVVSADAPTVGQEFTATVTAVDADGSAATGFIGGLTVTFTDLFGGTQTATDIRVDIDGKLTVKFTPTTPGAATIRAEASQATAGSLAITVAPAAPGTSPLRDPQLKSQEQNARILAAGQYFNSDNQAGNEPVAVNNLIGEASISVLHISPDHVRNYPQPITRLTDTSATSATAANLDGNGPGGGIPDDVALTTADGRVVVAITVQDRVKGTTQKGVAPYGPVDYSALYPVNSPDPGVRSIQLENRRRHTPSPPGPSAPPTEVTPPPPESITNRFSASSFTVGGTPTSIVAGHFFNTTFTDLAVANPGSNTVNLLRNTSNGQFRTTTDQLNGVTATAVVAGRIFGGTLDDLAVVDGPTNVVRLYKNDGAGNFSLIRTKAATLIVTSGTITKVVAADFDGDGLVDIAAATTAGKVEVFYQVRAEEFTFADVTAGQVYDAVFAGRLDLLAVDLTGDGRPELVVGSTGDPGVAVLTQAGKGLKAFYGVRKVALPPLIVDTASGLPGVVNRTTVALATRDFDGDGLVDIAVLDNLSEVYTLSRRPAPPPPV